MCQFFNFQVRIGQNFGFPVRNDDRCFIISHEMYNTVRYD